MAEDLEDWAAGVPGRVQERMRQSWDNNPIKRGMDKVGQLYDQGNDMISGAVNNVQKMMTPKEPMGDIELKKEPKLMGGSTPRVIAENIHTLVKLGYPEVTAIAMAQNAAKAITSSPAKKSPARSRLVSGDSPSD